MYFGYFCKNVCHQELSKRPILVTLLTDNTHLLLQECLSPKTFKSVPFWSHCLQIIPTYFVQLSLQFDWLVFKQVKLLSILHTESNEGEQAKL